MNFEKKNKIIICFLFFIPFLLPAELNAQDQNSPVAVKDTARKSFANMTLEQLMQLEIIVATKTEKTAKDAPGIVSLITKEQIRKSGARDLIDVLRLVPGLDFGIDVRSVTSLGIRGNWAHEGKVLLLWDGQILNEMLFPSIQLGNHYPVDLIERIEIIRGPGSAVYGNYAELGVINIITTPAANLNGAYANAAVGLMANTFGRQHFSIAMGKKSPDFNFDFSLFSGSSNRSDQIMADYHQDNEHHSYDMSEYSSIMPFFLNTGIEYKGLKGRFILDRYFVNDRTMYGVNLNSAPRIDFITYIFNLEYEYKITEKLSIIPRIVYNQNMPWSCLDLNYTKPIYLDKWSERHAANINVKYDADQNINLLGGVEFYLDKGFAGDSTFFSRDPAKKNLMYSNAAAFAQGIIISDIADFTLGARYEYNSVAGGSFVPRIAVTKTISDLYLKILYSFAFRSPGIENISRYASTPIGPEKTTVFEFQAGYQFFDFLSVNANFYDITIKDPIVFMIDPILKVPAYNNGSSTGTTGIEAELRLKIKNSFSVFGYSYYKADKNEVADFVVDGRKDILIGFPQHKITADCNFMINENLSVNVNAVYLSERYADNDVEKKQFRMDPILLLNLFINIDNLFDQDISFGAGVYDLFDARYKFIQPYKGGSAPLPGPSREIIFRLSYHTDF